MIKKIIIGGTISLALLTSAIVQANSNVFYATYQKTNSYGDWVLSRLSSSKPENIRVGVEEVLEITEEGVAPLFSKKNEILVDGVQAFDCDFKALNYNACSSRFSIESFLSATPLPHPPGINIKVYNVEEIQKAYKESKTQAKINEFKRSRVAFKELKETSTILWLELLEELHSDWESYKTEIHKVKQNLSIKDSSGLFLGNKISTPLFSIQSEMLMITKPVFLQDSYLSKYDPDNYFSMHQHLEGIERFQNSLPEMIKKQKDFYKSKLVAFLKEIPIEYRKGNLNGWRLSSSGPKTIDIFSSNRVLDIDVEIFSKSAKNITPSIIIEDSNLKVDINHGDIKFKNNTDEKEILITQIKVTLDDKEAFSTTPLQIKPLKTTGHNLFELCGLENPVYQDQTINSSGVKKISLEVIIDYEIDGKKYTISDTKSERLSKILRKI